MEFASNFLGEKKNAQWKYFPGWKLLWRHQRPMRHYFLFSLSLSLSLLLSLSPSPPAPGKIKTVETGKMEPWEKWEGKMALHIFPSSPLKRKSECTVWLLSSWVIVSLMKLEESWKRAKGLKRLSYFVVEQSKSCSYLTDISDIYNWVYSSMSASSWAINFLGSLLRNLVKRTMSEILLIAHKMGCSH